MSRIFLLAKSPKANQRLKSWRDELETCVKSWRSYCQKIGAKTYLQFQISESPRSFSFPRGHTPPDGWCKPSGKHMVSYPRKTNKAALAEIAELPSCTSEAAVAAEFGLPCTATWDTGSMSLTDAGFFSIWKILWVGEDVFVLVGPDIRETYKEEGHNPGFRFNVGDGSLPLEDFDLITEAQFDLLVAQDAVRREQQEPTS